MNTNLIAITRLIKLAAKENKKKPKKYTTAAFEKKVGLNPMTVEFTKRTDGTRRKMNFIRDWDMLQENADVYNFKLGTNGAPFNYSKNNLSLVWDLDKNAYRMVNLNTIHKLKPYKI